jgi:hypothetical protein
LDIALFRGTLKTLTVFGLERGTGEWQSRPAVLDVNARRNWPGFCLISRRIDEVFEAQHQMLIRCSVALFKTSNRATVQKCQTKTGSLHLLKCHIAMEARIFSVSFAAHGKDSRRNAIRREMKCRDPLAIERGSRKEKRSNENSQAGSFGASWPRDDLFQGISVDGDCMFLEPLSSIARFFPQFFPEAVEIVLQFSEHQYRKLSSILCRPRHSLGPRCQHLPAVLWGRVLPRLHKLPTSPD